MVEFFKEAIMLIINYSYNWCGRTTIMPKVIIHFNKEGTPVAK